MSEPTFGISSDGIDIFYGSYARTYPVPRPGDVVDYCQTLNKTEADGTTTSRVCQTAVLVFDVDEPHNPVSALNLRFFRWHDDVDERRSVPHALCRGKSCCWWEWPSPREYRPLPDLSSSPT